MSKTVIIYNVPGALVADWKTSLTYDLAPPIWIDSQIPSIVMVSRHLTRVFVFISKFVLALRTAPTK